ncbi:MAG TPA: dipeptidase [Terriglobales bacterium]|jgi:membrane dipeptidase
MSAVRLLSLVLFTSFVFAQGQASPEVSARARALHQSSLVVDTHADTPQRFLDTGFDIGSTDPADQGQISLDKARAGNLGAEFFSIWVDPETVDSVGYAQRASDLIDAVYQQAERHPDRMMMAYGTADIERAHKEKKLAALLGIEGGHAIQDDLHLLRNFYRLGVRYMTLSWSNTNHWADSSGDIDDPKVQHHNGLTDFGKEVVLEMNRLGMMVDISHVADKTFYDAVGVSKAPVIASHSSARALTNVPRNMTDDMLLAVKKNNGVVMVNFYSGFVDENYRAESDAQAKDRDAAVHEQLARERAAGKKPNYVDAEKIQEEWMARIPRPPLKSLIDHIDHIAKIAGIDHVGLGSDFDGVSGALPEGIHSAADLPKITEALLDRGYKDEDVRKILGGNLLRVFRDVERVSREMQSSQR